MAHDCEYRIIAVIHHRDDSTTIAQAGLALDEGCWGAAVISMDGTPSSDLAALDAARTARLMFSNSEFNIGLNALSMKPADVFLRSRDAGLDFTWVDDPGIRAEGVNSEGKRLIEVAGHGRDGDHLLFAGAGFKTHGHVADPGGAARAVNNLGWIPTTSGPATGVAPSAEYLETMCRAIEPHGLQAGYGLAVASGITPENAPLLLPFVDWVLVATGIGRNFHEIDPVRLRALVREARIVGYERTLRSKGFPEAVVSELSNAMRLDS